MQLTNALQPSVSQVYRPATEIPALTHDEAMMMASEELKRFLELAESLHGDDWKQSTACTLWNVRDIVAHQAAHVRSFTSIGEFIGQFRPGLLRPYRQQGMNPLDALNQAHVDLRRNRDTHDLVVEIRDLAARSLAGRNHIPRLIRALKPTLPGLEKGRSLGYLFDLIYTRDMWMHRIDIYRAIGRPMPLDAAHDGRSAALIVRDFSENAAPLLRNRAVALHLSGEAGGSYHIGPSSDVSAVLALDALEFCILSSGRMKPEALEPSTAITGDARFGSEVLSLIYNRVMY